MCSLRERYRLAVRSGWWADEMQVEVLAALAAWVERYDSGEWDDPPGKLALLFDLERVAALLRDGVDPFHPDRDRAAVRAPSASTRVPAAAEQTAGGMTDGVTISGHVEPRRSSTTAAFPLGAAVTLESSTTTPTRRWPGCARPSRCRGCRAWTAGW